MKDKLLKHAERRIKRAQEAVAESMLKDEKKVAKGIQQARHATCVQCKYHKRVTDRCSLCGCFMGVKTWMKSQKCPIDKWGPGIDIQEIE